MNAGDTLYIRLPGTSLDSHLWVVISDPQRDPDRIVIVNFTTARLLSDRACVLNQGDHPFIKHETCVNYAGAKCEPMGKFQKLLDKGLIQNHSSVKPGVLARIREGATASRDISTEILDILESQDII